MYNNQSYSSPRSRQGQKQEQRQRQPRREGKTPVIICTILTIFALLTVVLGFVFKNPYFVIAGILPVAIYEAWRTEGFFTKAASVGIVILVILEILAILNVFTINLAQTLQEEEAYLYGYYIQLGDIKFVFPAAAVVLSIVLIYYTYGKYTKWLSVLLLISSVALLYLINTTALLEIIRNFI